MDKYDLTRYRWDPARYDLYRCEWCGDDPPPTPKPKPPPIKEYQPMGTDIARRVKTHTTGGIAVELKDVTLQDLKDFTEECDIHGVEPDAVVSVRQEQQYDGTRREHVPVTRMAVEAPVQFTMGSPTTVRHPRAVARDRIAKKAFIGTLVAIPASLAGLFLLGLFLHLLHVLLGWV